DLMLATPADFFLHVGDVMYDFGWDTEFFVPYRDLLARIPIWMTVGNHDVVTPGGVPWNGLFLTPANNPAGVPHYYSFDAGYAPTGWWRSVAEPSTSRWAAGAPHSIRPKRAASRPTANPPSRSLTSRSIGAGSTSR